MLPAVHAVTLLTWHAPCCACSDFACVAFKKKALFCACSDFACVAWSLARLRHRPGTLWLEDYSEEARRRLPHLPSQQVRVWLKREG